VPRVRRRAAPAAGALLRVLLVRQRALPAGATLVVRGRRLLRWLKARTCAGGLSHNGAIINVPIGTTKEDLQ